MMNFYVVGVTMSHTRFVSNTANNAFVPSGGFGGIFRLHMCLALLAMI